MSLWGICGCGFWLAILVFLGLVFVALVVFVSFVWRVFPASFLWVGLI